MMASRPRCHGREAPQVLRCAAGVVGKFAVNAPFTADPGRPGDDGVMPKPALPAAASVYQLRVVLRAVSPLIWRRVLVRGDCTLADLHAVLQATFAWSDVHLHRFKIHGREYDGIDDSREVRLADLGLRVTERFVYDYDLGDLWRHDIRLEQILDAEVRRTYPVCSGGRRAGPPEDCGGPWAFVEQTQPHRIFAITVRVAEIIGHVLDDVTVLDDYRDELACLQPWLDTERFDRRALNRALAELSVREEHAA
jgi:hypothetical protein